ncbi:MAG: spheroidene monooxygenase [Chitinophagaceae bacterium]|nr:spheroidene monooxygenase [Chitinophagaceae bacterium]
MYTSLTIIKYKNCYTPFAFLAMGVFRLPLWLNKNISFYKLMGSGKNGTFDKTPDLQQWAILTVDRRQMAVDKKDNLIKNLYGSFIAKWLKLFQCNSYTYLLTPIEGHGLWDGKKVFGELPVKSSYEGKIAVLTRATIRLSRLKHFWKNVNAVASQMASSKGFVTSYGIGEIPWIKQATFSIWESKTDMKNFAYSMQEHKNVIQKTRQEKWYTEDMFVRFVINDYIINVRF